MRQAVFLFVFFISSVVALYAQHETAYNAEIFTSIAEDHTPFWTLYRNWGVMDLKKNDTYIRAGVFHKQKLSEDWSAEAGVDIPVATSSNYENIWIQQLYASVKWKPWTLFAGIKENYTSELNPRLSSGDFVKSNNSRPMPEINLKMDYLPVPYTKGIMYIQGDFAVGKYLDDDYKKNIAYPAQRDFTLDVYSHHKSIRFKFGDVETRHKMQFIAGMDHVAQWGGTFYKYSEGGYTTDIAPMGIIDFIRIVCAAEGRGGANVGDQVYVAGSQWGSYIFKFDYKLSNNNRLSAYVHHFFDDGSGMVLENYQDNLIGLEWKSDSFKWLSNAEVEYVYTKQQTGPIHRVQENPEYWYKRKTNGNDNYYNNYQYVEGPSYFGKSQGTPLFLSPEYNSDGTLNFKGSRIWAFHVGLSGYLHSSLQYTLLFTTAQNWGLYYLPFREIQSGFASHLELKYLLPAEPTLTFNLSVGYDKGAFFGGDTFGVSLAVRKTGLLFH